MYCGTRHQLLAALVAIFALSNVCRVAAQATWNNSAGGSWNDAASWTPASVPNAAGTMATFGPAATSTVNVSLAADVVAGAITFDAVTGNRDYLMGTAGRTITLASANGTTGTQITVNSNVDVGLTGGMEFAAAQTLLIADSGGLSISNLGSSYLGFYGPVVLPNGEPLAVTSVPGSPMGVQFADHTLNGTVHSRPLAPVW